jgi:hypothetical protein
MPSCPRYCNDEANREIALAAQSSRRGLTGLTTQNHD